MGWRRCARHTPVSEIVEQGGVGLVVESHGEGPAVVGLHGLTAMRRYVLMGSRALEQGGRRVVLYDARAHGNSSPAPDGDYSYEAMSRDLTAVLDACGVQRALIVGASMGAHTAIRFALEHPERVAGLAVVTPAFDPERATLGFDHWDALARGLREGGVDGFIAAYELERVPERWRETIERVIRQRIAAHAHPLAVADALEAVPRSRPFEDWASLRAIEVPTLIVASRDEADHGHPLEIAQRYAQEIPGARLVVEDEGRSPIAWQGGQLSRLLLDF
jgi:pimeloyl-ACP methyl ester carboxylesterase